VLAQRPVQARGLDAPRESERGVRPGPADLEGYFELFTPEAVFLGTDPGERWSVEEFRAYAEPLFRQGRGWTYRPAERHVVVASGGGTAWFDELLVNEKCKSSENFGQRDRPAKGRSWCSDLRCA